MERFGKRFRISWRVWQDATLDPEAFGQFLDMIAGDDPVGDELWVIIYEPTFNGYEPLEEIARRCELYKAPAAAARARGIRVGINPWPTFGVGEVYQEDQGQAALPFQGMVGMDGRESTRVACPVSPEFLDYAKARYRLFAQAGCSFLWVDDDCRFTHLTSEPYPCFCPRCVRGFAGGRFRDRESLVAALNDPSQRALRREWSAYGARRLAAYCAAIRQAVDEVDPGIEMPFMSVGYSHTTYAGDYIRQCMKALRAKSARPGHGFYTDYTPLGMFYKAYEMARQVVNMPAEALSDVQYEEDSYPRMPLNKTPQTRLMEMALAVWGGCTGVATCHVLHTGGPRPFDWLKYETSLLRANRAFFDEYLTFASGLPQAGVWAAFSEWAMSGMKVGDKGWFDEHNGDYDANKFIYEWPLFGIPVTADSRGAFAVLLQGRMADVFDEDELNRLLEKPVILDGMALQALWERGLGERAGVRVTGSRYGGEEELAPGPCAGEFAGSRRMTINCRVYDLEPVAPGVEPLAYTVRPYGAENRLCAARYGSAVTLGYDPYRCTGTPGRLRMMRELLKSMGAPVWLEPVDAYDPPRVAVFARADAHRAAVLLINATTGPSRPFELCFRGGAQKAVSLGLNRERAPLSLRQADGFRAAYVKEMAPWEMNLVLIE